MPSRALASRPGASVAKNAQGYSTNEYTGNPLVGRRPDCGCWAPRVEASGEARIETNGNLQTEYYM
jgi:hypothetical protein